MSEVQPTRRAECGNGEAAAGRVFYRRPDASMAAFDALPAPVRARMQRSTVCWDAIEILHTFRLRPSDMTASAMTRWLLDEIERQEQRELRAFAERYQQQYGLPYAGLAAA